VFHEALCFSNDRQIAAEARDLPDLPEDKPRVLLSSRHGRGSVRQLNQGLQTSIEKETSE